MTDSQGIVNPSLTRDPIRAAASGSHPLDLLEQDTPTEIRWNPLVVREDFPTLARDVRTGVPLVYLDNAATALKPWPVIRAVTRYDVEYPANIHRGVHTLSELATEAYEQARVTVARFLNVDDSAQVIFTRGTTESINLVAASWGRANLRPGDEIVLTILEHHANLVPWQLIAEATGATIHFVGLGEDGSIDLADYQRRLGSGRVKIVGVTAMSNVLGTVPPLELMIPLAHAQGALVLVDAAQSVSHQGLDVAATDADFVAFSGHKLGGPTGIGVLYGRRSLLEAMPPFLGGGGMVLKVDCHGAKWSDLPMKYEAGTPPIAQAIGLGAAIDYLGQFDRDAIHRHEQELAARAGDGLAALPGVRLLRQPSTAGGPIVSFTVDGVHPHDLAEILDRHGVAIRAGMHCAMPLHECLGLKASARASFFLYNTSEEVSRLIQAVDDAIRVFHT